MDTKHIGVMSLTFQGEVTFAVVLVDLGNQLPLSVVGFQDIRPQTSSAHRHMLNRHCALGSDEDQEVFSLVTSNVEGKIERIFQIMIFFGAWRSGGMKSSDFYCKRHIV